jgi:Na+-transporting NADH:ubiquinone oxidoreductase subunit E
MTEFNPIGPLAVLFGAVFTNNILLTNYLGMCSFLSVSREVKSAAGLGAAVVFVMALANALIWPIHYYVLVPLRLEYLGFIVYIIVIAGTVQLVEMIIERVSEPLYNALGIFLPLITVNCAVFGAVLFMFIREYDFLAALAYGAGGGAGWALAIIAMAGIRQKIAKAPIPKGLEGPGITLITAGIMALAFMGFSGMVRAS